MHQISMYFQREFLKQLKYKVKIKEWPFFYPLVTWYLEAGTLSFAMV